MNMVEVLWQQRFGSFTMLVVEGCSQRAPFRHISEYPSVISKIQKSSGRDVFSKCLKFNQDLKNVRKNWEKVFCFWDNCIWIGIVKLSLSRTGYFSSGANALTSSTKILHVNKTDFFQLNFFGSNQWIS